MDDRYIRRGSGGSSVEERRVSKGLPAGAQLDVAEGAGSSPARHFHAHPQSPVCDRCDGTGIEWRDYWSQDVQECGNGCPDPSLTGSNAVNGDRAGASSVPTAQGGPE